MENIERIIKYGLLVSLFAPLVVTSSTFFPFVFGKAFFFQIIIEVCFFAWLGLLILNPQRYKPRLTILSWAVFAFLGVLLLSSLLGPDSAHSLWGNYERMEGWITLAHYGAFFLLLSVFIRSGKDWLDLLRTFLVVGILAFIYALGQKLGWPFTVEAGGGFKLAGPLGNSVLFASFLLFPLFISAMLFFEDESKRWRLFYIASFFTAGAGILLAAGRGPTAGAVLGAAVFLSLTILFCQRQELKKYFMGAGVLLIITALFFVFLQNQSWFQENPILGKYAKVSFRTGNLQSRLHNWQITWKGIKEKPILGYGQESNHIVFSKHYDPETLPYSNKWFDKPHNKYLELLVTSGFVGFGLYLVIFALSFWILGKARDFPAIPRFVLMGFLVAYLFQAVTLFDTPSSYIALFLFLGFISRLKKDPEEKPERNRQPPTLKHSAAYGIMIAMLVLAGFVIYQVNLKVYFAAQNGIRGLKLLYRGKQDASLESLKAAARWNSFGQPEVAYQTSQSLTTVAQKASAEKIKSHLEFNSGELKKATKDHPLNPRLFLALGDIESILARVGVSHLTNAESAFKQAHKLAPKRPEPFYKLIQIELMKGEKEQALSYARKAVNLNRDYNRSWWHLAEVNLARGEDQKGIKNAIRALQTGFPWKYAGSLNFAKKKDYEKITQILERYLQAQPDDVKIHASLVMMYAKNQKKDKALEHLNQAVEIKPDMKKQFENILGIKQNNT